MPHVVFERVLADNKPNEVRNWLESIEIGQLQLRNNTEPNGAPHCIGRILRSRIKSKVKHILGGVWRVAKRLHISSAEVVEERKIYRIVGIKVLSRKV